MAEAIGSSSTSSRASTLTIGESKDCKENLSQETKDMESVADNNSHSTKEYETVPGKEVDCNTTNAEGATSLESAVDRLLQKQRNELMYELRRIQHGDRPVTGQGNKEAVEQFFHRALHGETNAAENSEHRPEGVVVEVNALVERRPVSNVLHSAGFRRQLENALRGALGNVARGAQPRSLVRQRTASPAVVPQAAQSESLENNVAMQDRSRNTREHSEPTTNERNTTQEQTAETLPNAASVSVQNQIAGQLPQQRVPPVANAQAWLQQQPQNVNPSPQMNVWDTIEEAQRDNMIMEISELVQRQLVTGTLQGNFRNVLETRMRERVEQSGTDGQRVQQFIQSIPRSTYHARNDFSDLGIMGPGQEEQQSLSDHLDEMSVISATAAVTVPYTQSNAAMAREIHSLKQQMKEMMNMMKLNFDLTMDIQRSVRQEVAAAMNQNNGTATEPRITSRPVNDTQCLICLEKAVDTVLYQCGHMCLCHGCGMNLRQRGSNCPVCRAPIRDIIRAYKCNADDN